MVSGPIPLLLLPSLLGLHFLFLPDYLLLPNTPLLIWLVFSSRYVLICLKYDIGRIYPSVLFSHLSFSVLFVRAYDAWFHDLSSGLIFKMCFNAVI